MGSNKFDQIILLFILFLINGIFSMTEMAVVSVRKARLQNLVEEGSKKAQSAMDLVNNPNDFFSTIQIFISLVGVFMGAFGASAFSEPLAQLLAKVNSLKPVSGTLATLLVSMLITFFSLVIGELIPKRIAVSNPEGISMRMAGFMKGLAFITRPVVKVLSWATTIGIKILGVRDSTEIPVSEDEVKVMIEQGKQVGVFEEKEQDIVESVFRMSDRTVDAMMAPRTEITWIDLEEPVSKSLENILSTDSMFYPVVRGNPDNIIGVLSSKKLMDAYIRQDQIDFEKLAETPLFIPESKPALDVLDDLRDSGKQVAIVMDEYGGFSGMISLMDILEELIGDVPGIGDSREEPAIIQRSDGSWLLDGQLDIDELKEVLDVRELPDEDRVGFQTLGGFVLNEIGHIPFSGEKFTWSHFDFEVVDMDHKRIDKVMVTEVPAEEQENQDKDVVSEGQNSEKKEKPEEEKKDEK